MGIPLKWQEAVYDGKGEVLEQFNIYMSSAVLKQFLGFDSIDGRAGGGGVERSVVRLAKLDAWVAKLVQCLTESPTRAGTLKCFVQASTDDS